MSMKTYTILIVILILIVVISPLRTILISVISKLLGPTLANSLNMILLWLYAIFKWICKAHLVLLRNLITPKKHIYRDLKEHLENEKSP